MSTSATTKKVALVTGALGGIGTDICHALVNDGYHIIATYTPREGQETHRGHDWVAQEGLKEEDFTFIEADLTDHEATTQHINEAIEKLGRIDVLVNNAGITRDSTFKKMSFDQWSAVLDTNLKTLFTVTQPVYLKMLEQKSGRIISISSINGVKGQFGQANYSAAKAGIIGFSKALAQEAAKSGITVNVIAPGYTGTKMVMAVPEQVLEGIKAGIPMGRLAEPKEIAAAVMYLVSDGASFITGATINVNGGQYMQ
ncbi:MULTISPECIES: acetoacetyl-CoA reductase [unclassified Moraxella]|uniref:acetoacetyl-CoA reductase n=1 Tax=unclassified Moraxella TaxID=2685852 RepID=UPI003AF72220